MGICDHVGMDEQEIDLPDDVDALKAMVREGLRREARMQHLINQLQHFRFGARSEKLTPDQYALALEDLEVARAEVDALADLSDEAAARAGQTPKRRPANAERGSLPGHLPKIEVEILPPETRCPCCGGELHRIDADEARRLDVIPVPYHIVVTVRPKLACRACSDGVFQAPAPKHVVPGGLPTEDLIADILVRKHADHTPFYRQAQMMARYGIQIDRANFCNWAGRAAAVLGRIVGGMKTDLLASGRIFVDETHIKVLDPGKGQTKTSYFWAIARDDREHGGTDPPAVVYTAMPGRGKVWADKLLHDYHGIVQCDAYPGYQHIEAPNRKGGPGTLAFCWSHARRYFVEAARGGNAPIADEALKCIARLFEIERRIRGSNPEERLAVRQAEAKPLLEEFRAWLETKRRKMYRGSPTAEAIGYMVNQWDGLTRFLDDGRIDLSTNAVERSMRPIALQRKNALFAGHDLGAENWAVIASLIETCKLNGRNPQAYLADALRKIIHRSDADPIDDLMPYNWVGTAAAAVQPIPVAA